jgi:hypothetical protein
LPIVSVSLALVAASFPAISQNLAVTLVLALIGIGVTICVARRYRVNPRMAYQMHDYFVLGLNNAASLGDIKITFNGESVPRVVTTQLSIWNAGNTTVERSHIVEHDPITVKIKDGSSILGASLLNATHRANEFKIRLSEADRSRAFLEFDHLNAGNGARVQIIHAGEMNNVAVTAQP